MLEAVSRAVMREMMGMAKEGDFAFFYLSVLSSPHVAVSLVSKKTAVTAKVRHQEA